MKVYFTNTLTNKKEEFFPVDCNNIKMYVCGPTVYDRAHIGNARSSVVFDVLYRALCLLYPKVTYVRNITDIDDKIINAANECGEDIKTLTNRMTEFFHNDLKALNCLLPNYEPKATDNVDQMISMIERLISKDHAYVNNGHVYFSVNSFSKYGQLSNKKLKELESGMRIEISGLKDNPLDFVLWKPKKEDEKVYFDSPWGRGRPGWHIECSAMSKRFLGNKFDIHGGGMDLIFPHHENEIAQSVCDSQSDEFVKYWLHNGFLTVNSAKMSKSLDNFITVKELLDKGFHGSAIRYFYLTVHYRKPLDFNTKALNDSVKSIDKFRRAINLAEQKDFVEKKDDVPEEFLSYLADDLNTPLALSYIHKLSTLILNGDNTKIADLCSCCELLGIDIKFREKVATNAIIALAEKRKKAKSQKKWSEADIIRAEIERLGYKIIDIKDGYRII